LSGGERQRAAIARCLATDARILLLDEPTAHLDLEHDLSVLALCRRLAEEGRTVVLATHDLGSVGRGADRMVVLRRGRVAAAGRPDRVLTRDLCRDVFAVDAESVLTGSGVRALVFSPLGHP
jgi:iron complex transport system ATP-binding protein